MFWIIGGALVHGCIMGLLTSELAARKGYNGYFGTGFLLSSVGLLFVAGLTDNRILSAIESMKYSIKCKHSKLNRLYQMQKLLFQNQTHPLPSKMHPITCYITHVRVAMSSKVHRLYIANCARKAQKKLMMPKICPPPLQDGGFLIPNKILNTCLTNI